MLVSAGLITIGFLANVVSAASSGRKTPPGQLLVFIVAQVFFVVVSILSVVKLGV